ncbi:hypothetical protein [Methylovulum psychrotolerans]|uniref:Molecular chaperone DnaK n=1 Tax=Methylovulum psychrotolerans TaxID=1704499 RepID=A0A2S5CIU8_9GAMM|nr:hypothetical protein [Methylovulum psychrotolerans]POZ50733.1 hypothetical protein AADEFJLK_03630 [Methylovulum psychrotolerans]
MTTPVLNKLKAKYRNQQLVSFAHQLAASPFWWVVSAANSAAKLMLYDTTTRLLWDANPKTDKQYLFTDGNKIVSTFSLADLKNWRLPTPAELWGIGGSSGFPLHEGDYRRILGQHPWLCSTICIDMDNNRSSFSATGYIFCHNDIAIQKSAQQFLHFCLTKQWNLLSCTDTKAKPLLQSLYASPKLSALYPPIDYIRARLPHLEDTQFTDPAKGLWEFWGMDAATLADQGSRARNPALDIRDWNVAIDFGTSSTVVAYSENGQSKLLRIGVDDFWKQQKPEHYENPTVLEFVDFTAFIEAWQAEAYQPLVSWDDVRCSHEALHNLRNHETDPAVVASILCKIKQWALREGKDARTRITDRQHGLEHELTPLKLLQPVKGEALSVDSDYPFDPVELYAWYLGMTINWRGRGIFLRYYMTFPVDYPVDIKQKILASFRRGLQRSLPATLVGQEAFLSFKVEERASEPAAYAAVALPELNIEPTTNGTPYAVFDFGGGTADFDFGYYRLPTAEEEDEGTEIVMEHFGSSGDKYLGGENLLENMAYRVFLHNIEVCRKKKVAFTRPLDADDFAGSEMFLEKTQAALTNSLMLISRLRPLWETGKNANASGIEKIQLINRDGQKSNCEFAIPEQVLFDYLEERIEQGVVNFFIALKKAFADKIPSEIHILLAGNASRSPMVQALFGLMPEGQQTYTDYLALHDNILSMLENLFDFSPTLIVHPPLPIDDKNVYRPTGKTGVALGLLQLCPGSAVEVINRTMENSLGEAPFAFYVGRIRSQRFQPALKQGAEYQQWHEIGPYREGVFNLVYSQSPKANTGEMREGEAGLIYKRLDLFGANGKLFARIIAPDTIQLCTATSAEAIHNGSLENLRELKLV